MHSADSSKALLALDMVPHQNLVFAEPNKAGAWHALLSASQHRGRWWLILLHPAGNDFLVEGSGWNLFGKLRCGKNTPSPWSNNLGCPEKDNTKHTHSHNIGEGNGKKLSLRKHLPEWEPPTGQGLYYHCTALLTNGPTALKWEVCVRYQYMPIVPLTWGQASLMCNIY